MRYDNDSKIFEFKNKVAKNFFTYYCIVSVYYCTKP